MTVPRSFHDIEGENREIGRRSARARVNVQIDASKLVLTFPPGTEVEGEWWWHLGERAAMPLIIFVVTLLSLFGLGYLARAALSFVRRRAKS